MKKRTPIYITHSLEFYSKDGGKSSMLSGKEDFMLFATYYDKKRKQYQSQLEVKHNMSTDKQNKRMYRNYFYLYAVPEQG